jgi:hypothetical protein
MSKVQGQSDLSQIKDTDQFRIYCSRIVGDIVDALNGNVDFGPNIPCTIAKDITFVANQVQSIAHTLGRVPNGYICIRNNIPNVNFALSSSNDPNPSDKFVYIYTGTPCTASFLIF